ncbi:DUF4255 domain-containing protein [Spirosoma radiotolerans]|uniref:Pvc16 N-terminal domain-containing protein n=1 Tax=Spirosoma radiotolerans TaxID=1379870 RepID=A0A0E3ZW87_9BACT|nr:DUF4255 domain-containing protein [Spirosoma radiotolerans]AKD55549.1 hypothetical protein SD10_12220 [Spirosoma radiotolerans]
MVRTALEFIQEELDAFLAERDPDNYSAGNISEVVSLIRPDGSPGFNDTNHIAIVLAGIEEEQIDSKYLRHRPAENNQFVELQPPVSLNLYVLFVAHKPFYLSALRDVSNVIGFFQENPVFDQAHYPNLNTRVTDPLNKSWQLVDRLTMRLHNLTFEQQNNLWASLGTKQMPSVVYKMRLLTIFSTRSKQNAVPITTISGDSHV